MSLAFRKSFRLNYCTYKPFFHFIPWEEKYSTSHGVNLYWLLSGPGKKEHKIPTVLLSLAHDRQLKVDIQKQFKFPGHTMWATLWPDLVMISEFSNQLPLLKLTISWEDWLEKAHKLNKNKYPKLIEAYKVNGWR